jgi:hypothetical protein
MRFLKLIPFLVVLSVCEPLPALADGVDEQAALTTKQILGVMAQLPPEGCLYNAHGRSCDRPGGFDRGPDAKRIADAIVATADGRVTGDRELDASLMAVYSSYESGNDANAKGDSGRSLGAWQIMFIGETMYDPMRAAPVWRARAIESARVCGKLPVDEQLASLAGGCMYPKTRQKVRQRMQAARTALAAVLAQPE